MDFVGRKFTAVGIGFEGMGGVNTLIDFALDCVRNAAKGSIREWLAKKNIVVRWMLLYALLFWVILMGNYGPGYSAAEFIYQGF